MLLRWFVTCTETGLKSEPILQCWSKAFKCWIDIPYIECKIREEETYLTSKFTP